MIWRYWLKEDFFSNFCGLLTLSWFNLIQQTDSVLLCLIILLWILVGLFGIMVLVARHFWSICSRGLEKSQRTAEAARSDGHSKTLQQDRTRFLLRNNNILLLTTITIGLLILCCFKLKIVKESWYVRTYIMTFLHLMPCYENWLITRLWHSNQY